MPLYAVLVREYFGPRIIGTVFGAARLRPASAWPSARWPAAWCSTPSTPITGSTSAPSRIGITAVAVALSFPSAKAAIGAVAQSRTRLREMRLLFSAALIGGGGWATILAKQNKTMRGST